MGLFSQLTGDFLSERIFGGDDDGGGGGGGIQRSGPAEFASIDDLIQARTPEAIDILRL